MHRWIVSLLVLAGSASFTGGALVGAHSTARAAGACHARGHGLFSLPDPRCTPGADSPAVTQADIGRTISHAGWSESVRPPESVTERERRASSATTV